MLRQSVLIWIIGDIAVKETKLLLVSVFGPYGIKNKYDEGLSTKMEPIHITVAREQGLHSPRLEGTFSFGLYLMAKNISVPAVVLDFPRWEDFTIELRNGYTHVGITFICANILKAQRMAGYIRKHHPDIKIILGGDGANIPELKEMISYDEVCYGEGIRWLQKYFGEDVEVPIKECIYSGPQIRHLYGLKERIITTSIFPGVGCPNACDFCTTSYKFGKRYNPFIKTGKEMFDLLHKEEKKYGVQDFTIEDENFLKQKERAIEMLAEMEKANKAYTYFAFLSVDTFNEVGIDFVVRLGINFIWLGIETKVDKFNKHKNTNMRDLIRELRSNGIKVVGSAMLFLDHHDKNNILEDIDWAVDLGMDLVQFLGFAPAPGTKLFEKLRSENRLVDDFSYDKLSGIDEILVKHPHFKPDETGKFVRYASRKNYEVNGPFILNMIYTSIRGYRKVKQDHDYRKKEGLAWNAKKLCYEKNAISKPDDFMESRLEQMRITALKYRPLLLTIKCFSPNQAAREKCDMVSALYTDVFGRPGLKDRLKSIVILGLASIKAVKLKWHEKFGNGDLVLQPPMVRTEYNMLDSMAAPP